MEIVVAPMLGFAIKITIRKTVVLIARSYCFYVYILCQTQWRVERVLLCGGWNFKGHVLCTSTCPW